MVFTLNADVAAVLAAAFEQRGPPPAPPAGDVASRRVGLDAMLEYFNNQAQPVASKVISDHSVITPDGVSMLSLQYRLAPVHPIPLRLRTPTPDWSGSPTTPPSSASTPAASRSWATAPAAGSPPASPS